MWLYILFVVLLPACCLSQQQNALPQTLPPVISQGHDGVCPSAEESAAITEEIFEQVEAFVSSHQLPCPCGGPGQWTRIAHLNMSDPSQQCPSSWSLITTPVRGCSRSTNLGCDSVTFTSSGLSYSRVCGRVISYQDNSPDAFWPTIGADSAPGLENAYVDGVSLTHGAPGSRQHIWTFAAALYETGHSPVFACACSNTNEVFAYDVPAFVGDNYFCDSGNPGPEFDSPIVYADDPLWDGEGCGPTSTCCEFNNPPWFCTTLPQPQLMI